MSGTARQFVDFSSNTAGDSGENNAASVEPYANGEDVNQTVLNRPIESLRQRSEAIRTTMADSLYLRDADRKLMIVLPAGVGITWPGSTTVAATGIPVLTGTLWMIPMLTPGFAQAQPIPPVASAFGVLHLKRASDSLNSISVTSRRRSYAAGDQINVTVSAGSVFSCTLDTETGYQRTIRIVATGATTLTTVINALNALLPSAPDNTQLVTAALEGGAAGGDLILTSQAKQYVSGNYDGEGPFTLGRQPGFVLRQQPHLGACRGRHPLRRVRDGVRHRVDGWTAPIDPGEHQHCALRRSAFQQPHPPGEAGERDPRCSR
jgi:hypothetical protein